MLSMSFSARMLAPRLVAAAIAPAAAVAAAAPRAFLSRGMATKSAGQPAAAAAAATPAAASPSATAAKATKKTAAAPKATTKTTKATTTTGRGARRTTKAKPSAASADRAAANLAKQAKRSSAIKVRQAKADAARAARRLRAQLKREKKRTLLEEKAARRNATIAKNRERIAKKRELQAQRRARELLARSRRRAELEETLKSKLQRALSFADKHPVVARRRAEEAAGLPVHPRRPISAYNSFMKQRVAELKAQSADSSKPKLSPTQMMKQAAADFKSLSADEKARLDAEYQKNATKFEAQKRDFEASQPPKKPLSPYIVSQLQHKQNAAALGLRGDRWTYFTRVNGDVMRANPGLNITQVASKIGEQWRSLSESEKAPFASTYAKELAAWKDKLAAWVEAHPGAHLVRYTKPSMTSVRKELAEKNESAKAAKSSKKAQ